jgi:hypothetical protein
VGAIVAGFVLIPSLGAEKSFFVVSLVYGLAAGIWCLGAGGNRRWMAIGGVVWILGLAFFPFGRYQGIHIPASVQRWKPHSDATIQAIREGRTETIVYLQAREFGQPLYTRMLTNSFSMSANAVSCDRYMKQFVYWPVALHPAPRRGLLICFGVGSTAQALTRTRELERIDVVDLSREILEMSPLIFPDPASHPLKDPRVTVHVEDGRFFLQTRSETWDIITGEPPPPDLPGVAGLYSREYFRLLKDRLSEDGIATYWLPIHSLSERSSLSILKAWSDVFETCFLWRGANHDLMLTGFRGRPSGSASSGSWLNGRTPRRPSTWPRWDWTSRRPSGPASSGTETISALSPRLRIPRRMPFRSGSWLRTPRRSGSMRSGSTCPPAPIDSGTAHRSRQSGRTELKGSTSHYFVWEGILSTLGARSAGDSFPISRGSIS